MRIHATLAATVLLGLLGGCASHKPQPAPAVAAERDWREASQLAVRAQQAYKAGRLDESIELNQKALSMNGELAGAWNNLGMALLECNRGLDAMPAFQRAADLVPTDPRPYENIGVLYFRQNWYEDAIRYYERSLERDPYWLPSLRGAVVAAKELLRSDEAGLERVKRGLMVEQDPAWRRVFEAEQMRVRQDVATMNKGGRS